MKLDLTYALSCKKGGFVSLRHNHIGNITASLLTEVCKDIRVEPFLQQLTGETLQNHTTREFYIRFSEMISEKRHVNYSTIATWIRGKITFSLIKSIGLCTRGRRLSFSSTRLKKSIDEDAHTSELTSRIA